MDNNYKTMSNWYRHVIREEENYVTRGVMNMNGRMERKRVT
jgi:hypothetical protein